MKLQKGQTVNRIYEWCDQPDFNSSIKTGTCTTFAARIAGKYIASMNSE